MANSVTFDLFARDRASGAFSKVGQSAETAGKKVHGLSGAFGAVSAGSRGLHSTFGLIGRGAAVAAGAAGIGGLIAGFRGVFAEGREAQKVGAQTAAVIKSTGGAAQVSAAQVGALATAISNQVGVDDELIQSGENLLLTFTGIGRQVFPQASRAIVDMTAAMNGGVVSQEGLKASAVRVGRALQDPIKGVTALTKAGVSFTEKQKAQIKSLVEHGHALDAQKIILGELNREFSGSAAAGTNAMQKLGVVFGNIKEQVGTALLPIIDRFAGWLAGVLPGAVAVAGKALGVIGRAIMVVKGGFTEGLQGNTGFTGFLERVGNAAHGVATFFTGTLVPGVRALGAAFRGEGITSNGFVGVMERIGVAGRNVAIVFQRDWLPVIRTVATWVTGTLLPVLGRLALQIGPILGQAVASTARWIMGTAVPAVKSFAGWISGTLWPAVTAVAGFFARTFAPTVRALAETFQKNLLPPLQRLWAALQRNMPAFIATAKFIGTVIGVVVVLVAKIAGFLLPILIRLAGFFIGKLFVLLAQTVQYFGNVVRAVQGTWHAFQTFWRILSGVFTAVTRAVSDWRGKVIALLGSAGTWLINAGRRIVSGLWGGVTAAWGGVARWFAGMGGRVGGWFASAGRWLATAGYNIIGGLWSGFRSAMGGVGRILGNVKDAIVGGLKRLFGISSPSTVMAGLGVHIITGLIKGLLTKSGALARTVRSIGGNVANIFGATLGNVGGGLVPDARPGSVQAMVKGYAQQMFGWQGAQWDALYKLIMRESGFNPNAQNPTSTAYGIFQFLDSVPLDTECLTRDGWKTWDQIRPGVDETLGFNPATGTLEWTPILEVVTKPSRPVVGMQVGNWRARVTPGHRWWSERRTTEPVEQQVACPDCGATGGKRGPFVSTRAVQTHAAKAHGLLHLPRPYVRVEEFVRTAQITKAHRLRVAAPLDDDAGNDRITLDEAALLGWIVGDGHINHASRTVNVWVFQAKPRYVDVIDALLVDMPHSRYVRDRQPGKHLPSVSWRLSSPYARDLLERSGLLDGTPEGFVLSLSAKQRAAWLEAVWQAEGWTVASGADGEVRRISQNDGAWADAMTLAVYLAGHRPTRHLNKRTDPKHSDNWVITFGRPWVGGTAIQYEDLGEQPVWCIRTGLGTWTMRQDGLPMVTGNSTWGAMGVAKSSNPNVQTIAGLQYIRQRYGDPGAAWAHEMMAGWYGAGMAPTVFSRPTLIGVGERGSETVTVVPHGRGRSGAGEIHIHLHGVMSGDERRMIEWVRKGVREALRREGKPATV